MEGRIEFLDISDASHFVDRAIENDFEYIQIGWIANGLGPRHMFNYIQLRLRKDDNTPPNIWEISEETKKYLINKYGDKIWVS